MTRQHLTITLGALALVALLFVAPRGVRADRDDCGTGYEFQPSSGVGCVQINCNEVPDAHYSYTSRCVCGSAGSEWENPADPNTSCAYPGDDASCPGCVYACVHANEECPDAPGLSTTNTTANSNRSTNANSTANRNTNVSTNGNASLANTPLSTGDVTGERTCTDQCATYLRGKQNASVVMADGTYPDCQCQIDVMSGGSVAQTIAVIGTIETTFTFDPSSGALLTRTIVDRRDEIEKIRKRLGYKYTEDQIDALLAPDKVDAWFNGQVKDIRTSTSIFNPQFWWQHVDAILDHGFSGNSADFVDVHQYGRCGDSMQWLERNLSGNLHLGDDPDEPGQTHEAMLSITGEKYGNMLNHTSLLIRPAGMTNAEWEDIVKELKALSGGLEDNPGMKPGSIQNIDPRLLDAKVLDPYKKQTTTVREFIKGWSYIRIS